MSIRKIMKKPCILGNWKMNLSKDEISSFFDKFKKLKPASSKECTIGFAVPAPYLLPSVQETYDTDIMIGSQNIHWEEKGAYTGEISNLMLKDCGANFCIVGHSERRTLFFETNQSVSKRALAAIKSGITAVVCVGETKEEFENGETDKILQTQVPESIAMLPPEYLGNLIIAYEPVWAIGTGLTATPEQAQSAHKTIRQLLSGIINVDSSSTSESNFSADSIPIIYGGSVKPENAAELISQNEIDGFLVGGASLSPESFHEICLNSIAKINS